MHSTKNNAHV